MTEAGYAAMTLALRRAGVSLGFPVGFVLEGGYALGALARSVAATMEASVGDGAPADDAPVPMTPLARRFREGLAAYWAL